MKRVHLGKSWRAATLGAGAILAATALFGVVAAGSDAGRAAKPDPAVSETILDDLGTDDEPLRDSGPTGAAQDRSLR